MSYEYLVRTGQTSLLALLIDMEGAMLNMGGRISSFGTQSPGAVVSMAPAEL